MYELLWLLEKQSPKNAKKLNIYIPSIDRETGVDNLNSSDLNIDKSLNSLDSRDIKEYIELHKMSENSVYYTKALISLSEIAQRNILQDNKSPQVNNMINAVLQNGELGLECLALLERLSGNDIAVASNLNYINSIYQYRKDDDTTYLQKLLDYREFISDDKNLTDLLEKYGL